VDSPQKFNRRNFLQARSAAMALLTAVTLFILPSIASAASFCERLPVDSEFPAGFAGSYDLIGKDCNAPEPLDT
jgi:hypothetical protein